MRYSKGQLLRAIATGIEFEVMETPESYSLFGKALYLLRYGNGSSVYEEVADTPERVTDRALYVAVRPFKPEPTKPKFKRLCLVREKATGMISIILGMPEHHRVESTFEPAYILQQGAEEIRLVVTQAVMEGGAYEPLPNAGYRDCDAS